jgi:hypothetical protein
VIPAAVNVGAAVRVTAVVPPTIGTALAEDADMAAVRARVPAKSFNDVMVDHPSS